MKHMSEEANSLDIHLMEKPVLLYNRRPCGNKGWPSGFINVKSVSSNILSWKSEELCCSADFSCSF